MPTIWTTQQAPSNCGMQFRMMFLETCVSSSQTEYKLPEGKIMTALTSLLLANTGLSTQQGQMDALRLQQDYSKEAGELQRPTSGLPLPLKQHSAVSVVLLAGRRWEPVQAETQTSGLHADRLGPTESPPLTRRSS